MSTRTLPAFILLALVACSTNPDDDTGDTTTSATTAGSADSTGDVPTTGDGASTGDASTGGTTGEPACVADDEMVFIEFSGPGYDPANGGLQPPLQDTYIASTTVLTLRPGQEDAFLGVASAMFPVLLGNPGLIGYSLSGSDKCATRRTLTVWRSEAAMFEFVMSDEHQAGASKALEYSTQGTVTHWEVTQAEVPVAWEDAITRVDALPKTY